MSINIKLDNLDINEVLRYLKSSQSTDNEKVDDNFLNLVNHTINKTLECISSLYVYKKFAITVLDDSTVKINDTSVVFKSKDITNHLKNCDYMYLIAITMGNELDRQIKINNYIKPDVAIIMDSCGSVAVECIADIIEKDIEKIAKKDGYNITWRYSPGYGDLPLQAGGDIIRLLSADKKIGLTTTRSFMMTPSKSVTTIIGLTKTEKDKRENKCDYCNNRENCAFRKRGTRC